MFDRWLEAVLGNLVTGLVPDLDMPTGKELGKRLHPEDYTLPKVCTFLGHVINTFFNFLNVGCEESLASSNSLLYSH